MTFSCCLIGADTLLLECGDMLLSQGHQIRAVVTASEKVRRWAVERDLRCVPLDRQYPDALRGEPFDYLFAITHLNLIPDEVLALPRQAAINFHDGPLPRYAGLNAPAWALMDQVTEYGITWHVMAPGTDEGDIVEQRTFEVAPDETSLTLNTRNFEVALETFSELVAKLERNTWTKRAQDLTQRTYFARHQRPVYAALVDWNKPAAQLDAMVRALDFGNYDNPLSVPKLWLGQRAIRLGRTELLGEKAHPPGTLSYEDGTLRLSTSNGELAVLSAGELDGALTSEDLVRHLDLPLGLLPAVPTPLRESLDKEQPALARAEAFWQQRLLASQPAEVVLAQATQTETASHSTWQRHTIPLPNTNPETASAPVWAVAAVALYLARTSGHTSVSLTFQSRLQERLSAELSALTSAFVPLVLPVDRSASIATFVQAVNSELESVQTKRSYFRDLVVRKPELAARAELATASFSPVVITWNVGETCEQRQLPPGAIVEVRVNDSGLELLTLDQAFGAHGGALASQLSTVIESVAAHANTTCRNVPLVNAGQSEKLLREWNDTSCSVPEQECIHTLFERQAELTPDRTALIFRDARLTYSELNRRAEAVARELRRRGAKPDQLFGVMLERSFDLVTAVLGVLKAGGAYVPLDPAYPADRIEYMLEDSGAQLVLSQSSLIGSAGTDVPMLAVDEVVARAASADGDEATAPHPAAASNLAYVIYTSGSTGKPKGVMVEHRNVVNFFVGMDAVIPRKGDGSDVWLAVTSLSFDISVLELFWTLSRGFTVVVHRDDERVTAAPVTTNGPSFQSDRRLDFSIFLWGADDQVSANKYDLMLHAGRFGDEHGFAAVWTPERHFHAFGGPYPNPAVTGAALAAVTSNIQIRAGSCVVPLHHPVRVAEEWAVIDNLSSGRAAISFASGWQPDDFLLRPEAFKENKKIMVEAIDQVRRLWRGEALSFTNGVGKDVAVVTQPRPVQAELPFWVTTAGNPETFRIAGESGANLLTHLLGQSLDELEGKVQVYREGRKSAGLDPSTGVVSLMLHTYVGTDDAQVKARVRQPMKDYLRSSVNLIKGFAWAFPAFKKPKSGGGEELALDGLSEDDLDTILDFAFERYYESSGLFGTPEKCLDVLRRLQAIGVNDIACLIDFGVPTAQVKEGLVHLAELKGKADALFEQRNVDGPSVNGDATADFSLGALAQRHAATHLQCTPALMRMAMMDASAKAALMAIPHLMLGGEALPLDLAKELASRPVGDLTNMYGPTETAIWSTTHRVEAQPSSVPLGKPIANTQLYVLDAERQLLPPGVPGELYIAGAGVVRGYYQRPELTQERFVPDPFTDGARMYRTGDLVRFRDDGVLEFLGRTDHQIKLRGYRIELGEIEAQLLAQPGVAEGVVVAREDVPGDQRLVAYYTGQAEAEALRIALRAVLPSFMVPSAFCCLKSLPQTPNGKIDRKALPAPEGVGATARAAIVAPESGLEDRVATLWQEVLGMDRVGVTDNFFDLGGHSLLVVRLHQMLKQALNPSIPMTALYRFPTIRSFVQNLNSGETSAAAKQAKSRGQMRREMLRRGARG